MKAADIMTPFVATVGPETTVAEAADIMVQHRVSGLPVVGENRELLGIITEGDFLRRAELGTQPRHWRWIEYLMNPERLEREYVRAHGRVVREIMTRPVYSVDDTAELDKIVDLMERRQIKRVPVVRNGRLVGIISRANLVRAAGMMARAVQSTAGENDLRIRDGIMERLRQQPWAPAAPVSVVVWDGTVHLWGTITEEQQREALRVLAESEPGVREVDEHLVLMEPMSSIIS